MRKNIDIKNELVDDIAMLAIKEKRRGKTDSKNFIEDVVETYVEENSPTKKKIIVKKKSS